jgi:hypothetical protein
VIPLRPARLLGVLRETMTVGPDLLLAATCLLALFLPRVEQQFGPRIGLILGLEFMGLHAFGFLGRIALAEPAKRSMQVLRVLAFIALCAIYTIVIFDWGTGAVMSFWIVTLSTYAGFLFHDAPAQRKRTLAYRWGVAIGLFFGMAIVTGLTAEYFNLRSPRKEFLFGFLFFAALAVCDLVRLYDRLEHRLSGSSPVPESTQP